MGKCLLVTVILFIVQNSKAGRIEIIPPGPSDSIEIEAQEHVQAILHDDGELQLPSQPQSPTYNKHPENSQLDSSIGRWATENDENDPVTFSSTTRGPITITTERLRPATSISLVTGRPNFLSRRCPPTVNCVSG